MSGPAWAMVIILTIGAVIALWIVLYHKLRAAPQPLKEGDVGFEREKKLFALYQNVEDMLDGLDSYVEETRAAIEMERVGFLREKEEIVRLNAQVLASLQRFREEIEAARGQTASLALAPPAAEPPPEPPAILKPAVPPGSARAQNIWALYVQQKPPEQIARELGIAQSEVNLTLKVLLGGEM